MYIHVITPRLSEPFVVSNCLTNKYTEVDLSTTLSLFVAVKIISS